MLLACSFPTIIMPCLSSSTLPIFACFLLPCLFSLPALASTSPLKIGDGYRLVSLEENSDGGMLGLLQVKQKTTTYGEDVPHLKLHVKHETEDRLRVHITDADNVRWEVPHSLLPRENAPTRFPASRKTTAATPVVAAEYKGRELIFGLAADPFGFWVRRKSDGATLFNTSTDGFGEDEYNTMVFKDQYLEISTKLPRDASLYGMGENTQGGGIKLRVGDPYTLYTTDVSAVNLNTDLYGSHPVYMDLRKNADGHGRAHGVLLLNSNGMDVLYRGDSLTYKVIGGVLDFYFFAGPTPLAVVDQYTQLVGRPAPMPYWSFGFHQCRWGYRNISMVMDVVENYRKAKIPLDVMWTDDDHMDWKKDFTLSPDRFPPSKLLPFVDSLHRHGMKYIVLIDPGIAINSSYGVYQRGVANDVFIKYGGQPYVAQVWPGAVHFPDFLNPTTASWWSAEINRFHRLLPVDGLWIDMNEPSNFCTGLCRLPKTRPCPTGLGPGWVCCLDCQNITSTRFDDPPYKINASGMGAPIGFKTIAASALHYNGVKEYDAHSLYGFSQTIATHAALLRATKQRPFVLTRSTFVGSGKYAAHWTGDNQGDWNNLRYSISTILNFGIFGIPMVGADICGFYPSPTEELCNRWIELGAFYPFSRDHANFYSPRQELYVWESVAESARNALGMRYRILPFLYTLSYEAHMTGAPIARPLFFTFPDLEELYGVSTQFMLGKSLMVSPVLESGKTEVRAVFPPGTWYSLFEMGKGVKSKVVQEVVLEAPLNYINVHLHEGRIVAMQKGGMVTGEARETEYTVVVAMGAGEEEGVARGEVYVDDDEEERMGEEGKFSFVEFKAEVIRGGGGVKVRSEVEGGGFAEKKGWRVGAVVVLGLRGGSSSSGHGVVEVSVDGEQVVTENVVVGVEEQEVHDYNSESVVKSVIVRITGLSLSLGRNFSLSFQIGGGD